MGHRVVITPPSATKLIWRAHSETSSAPLTQDHSVAVIRYSEKTSRRRIASHGFPRLEDLLASLSNILCICVVAAMHEQICHLITD